MKSNYEQELMSQLRIKGKLDLAEVMDMFKVSESTARRLFTKMEKEGKVIRIHGGIQLPSSPFSEYSFELLVNIKLKEKEAIAGKACDLLQDGDVIFCDAGTTVLCFCMELVRRMETSDINLKVYTNSLANFEVLASKVPVTLIGGEYRSYRKDFAGFLAETALSKVHFTKSFLGTDGCDGIKSFTTTDFDTARMDELVISHSEETMILCTADKFDTCAQVGFAEFSQIRRVITDSEVSQEVGRRLKDADIEVVVA